jgi:hypothetical protein
MDNDGDMEIASIAWDDYQYLHLWRNDARFSIYDVVEEPTISPNGGKYAASVAVTLATQTPGAEIFYTTNGAEPTTDSLRYTEPLTVTENAVLKAKAYMGTYKPSNTASAEFIIEPDRTPPDVERVMASNVPTRIRIYFSEPVSRTTAEEVSNYKIDRDVKVLSAQLSGDMRTVILETTKLSELISYKLRIKGISDMAESPNTINSELQKGFILSVNHRVTEGQIVFYSFNEGDGTIINDLSVVGYPLDFVNMNIKGNSNSVGWEADGLFIKAQTIALSAEPAKKIIETCRASGEITIEAWIKPADVDQTGPARIVSLSADPYNRNFTLGQDGSNYNVRLRTTTTGKNGDNPSISAIDSVKPELTHVVYTRHKNGTARIYIDGVEVASEMIKGDFSNWDNSYHLALANEVTRDRPWLGKFYLVAIYSRALTSEEVVQNYEANERLY